MLSEKQKIAPIDLSLENQASIKQKILELDSSKQFLPRNESIDSLLGINIDQAEKKINYTALKEKYPEEALWEGGSCSIPYNFIKDFLHELKLESSDIIYDLGSGFGRVPIYTALTTEARCKGIELIPERMAESNSVKNKLGIENLEFINGNVTEQDYSDGNVFFLFSPFSQKTMEIVGKKLKQIAENKKITVVSLGQSSTVFFNNQNWLLPIKKFDDLCDLTIFKSK
ncbi:MAG: hypothetical protein WCX88_00735 [Patescibacteria group bacterium]